MTQRLKKKWGRDGRGKLAKSVRPMGRKNERVKKMNEPTGVRQGGKSCEKVFCVRERRDRRDYSDW